MPDMSRPVQRQRRQVEYATKADVGILAAEVHGFREATAAEIRGLRESTKADVEVLAAEIRGLREATEAQIQGFREATEAQIQGFREAIEAQIQGFREAIEAQIQGFREATEVRLDAQDQAQVRMERTLERIDQRFDDQDARHRVSVRWIVGAVLAMGGLILTALSFGQPGGG